MLLARVNGISDADVVGDAEYRAGLRTAVSAAADYELDGIEREGRGLGPPPDALLQQARRAARSGVGLDVVIRRYIAGHQLFSDLAMQAIEEGLALKEPDLKQIWRINGESLDRLVKAAVAEYKREADRPRRDAKGRRLEVVKRLLAGQLIDSEELRYPLAGWHVAAIAFSRGAEPVFRKLGADLDRRVLLASPDAETVWAWIGGRRQFSSAELDRIASVRWPEDLALSLGEPGKGLAGWRLTHCQARDSAPIARSPDPGPVRYADVAMLASALKDEVLADSLKQIYIDPIADERDGGAHLKRTLRACLATGLNVSSAATVLGKSRQTVTSHLRIFEEKTGRSVAGYRSEIDTALKLEERAGRGV